MSDRLPGPPPPRRRGRPPRRAQAETAMHDTRTLLLRIGLEVLTEKGYGASGLDEILRRAGVTKSSFYHCFDDKEAFGLALVDAYADYFARKLDRHLLDATRTPLQRLDGFIDEASAGLVRHDFRRGCLIGNLGQEMAALPESFRARLLAVLADWQARTARCLQAAREAGEIAADAEVERLADFFWTGWEGAVLRARLERSTRPLRQHAEGFAALLRAGA